MRLAWFSPLPPAPSGVAACSADIVGELSKRHEIDVYVHVKDPREPLPALGPRESLHIYSAHDFVWRQRAHAYDLPIYQIGNSSHHDYIWPYLFRYPGLTVLHDVHVHHARAAALLRTGRAAHFRAEFAANHPDVSADLAELAVAGFDNHLYYAWPMSRLILAASRLTAVHSPPMAAELREEFRDAHITSIRLAHGERLGDERIARARARVRTSYGITDEAVLFGVFGGLTPDKRIRQILEALTAIIPYAPSAHLLLAGASARHYDALADVRRLGLEDRVTMTGYLATDPELTDCIAACDVSLNLRWPTAREMSGPWLRALAAARPTITVDLAHLVDVPSIDPRTWTVNSLAGIRFPESGIRRTTSGNHPTDDLPRSPEPGSRTTDSDSIALRSDPGSRIPHPDPVTIAVDILDEDHSLRLAMRRLATDPALRASLGAAGQRYWDREHSIPRMVDDYERVLVEAAAMPAPTVALPAHVVDDGDLLLNELLSDFGVSDVWS